MLFIIYDAVSVCKHNCILYRQLYLFPRATDPGNFPAFDDPPFPLRHTAEKAGAYSRPGEKTDASPFFGHLMPQNGSIEKGRGTPWHSKSGLFQSLTTNRARSAPNPEAGRAPAVRGAGLFPGKAQDAGLLQRSVRSAAGGPGVRGRQAGGKAGTRRGGQLQFQDQTLRLPAGDRRGGARARLLLPQSGALHLPQEHQRKP